VADPGPDLDGRSLLPYLEGRKEPVEGKEIFLYAGPGWPPTDKPWTPEGTYDEYRPWKYEGGSNLTYENQIIGIRVEDYKLLLNPGLTDGSVERDQEGYVLLDIRNDPMEMRNVANEKQEIFQQMKELLQATYQDVYNSEHAFEMPVYQIGVTPGQAYPVLAYGPRESSPGTQSASNFLSGFNAEGDWAAYDIRVEEEGARSLEVHYSLEGAEQMDLVLDLQGRQYPLVLLEGKGLVKKITVEMSEGFTTFKVSNHNNLPEAKVRLTEFTFTRTET
jgi:hypothetical protein